MANTVETDTLFKRTSLRGKRNVDKRMEQLLEEKAIQYSMWMHNVLTVPVLLLSSL